MRMDLDLQLYSIEESVNDRDNVVLKNLTKMEDMNTNKNWEKVSDFKEISFVISSIKLIFQNTWNGMFYEV